MQAQASFPQKFRESNAVHETIHAALKETNGERMDLNFLAQRVRQVYPGLDLEPTALIAEIKVMRNTFHQLSD